MAQGQLSVEKGILVLYKEEKVKKYCVD